MKLTIGNVTSLMLALGMTAACSEQAGIEETLPQNATRALTVENAESLQQNLVYDLGKKKRSRIYPARLKTDTYTAFAAQLNVTVRMPEAGTLTGISFRSDKGIVFIEFKNAQQENHIHLAKGEGISFVLPLAEDFAEGGMTVRLHVTGQRIIEQAVRVSLTAGETTDLRLDQAEVKAGNNWMDCLPDSTPLSQLSLPGTHDAATGNGTTLSAGKTQDLDLQGQWNTGIRVFDLRPAYKKVRKGWFKYENELHIFHGIAETNLSFADAINCLRSNLKSHPEESAIVIMRFENGGAHNNRDIWNDLMTRFLKSIPAGELVDYRPDLTLGDVRGKLLILSRDAYASTPVTGGFISGWSHSTEGSEQGTITGRNGQNGQLNIQDYYDAKDSAQKQAVVNAFMDKAAQNSQPSRLTINHTSGYTTTGINKGYYENAARVNPSAYRHIIDGNRAKGPVGIILMDHAGYRSLKYARKKYNVYGDLLPQAIIDNNFRAR